MSASAKQDVISHEANNEEAWICICGNEPSEDGFYPCDENGNEVEPVVGWSRYVCLRRGRIIDPDSLRVVGRTPQPKLLG
jgi:hypothetical protein